jgi:hypothetical protein
MLLFVVGVAHAENDAIVPTDAGKFFYIYHDKGDRQNHYIPSGWMGDYGDLKLNEAYMQDPADGRTAIEWTYNAQAKQGANWAGAYWQAPANNWGDKPGGYNLRGYKRLTFWAKADRIAKIAEFKVGGITGQYSDTADVGLSNVELGTKWQKYTIDLKDADLQHIVGGFCWSASRDDNMDGFKLYLDEIRFEK